MNCNIKHIENNSGVEYWCVEHKTKGTIQDGVAPIECDCPYKERYEHVLEMPKQEIKSIRIVYPNLNENNNVSVYINEKSLKEF